MADRKRDTLKRLTTGWAGRTLGATRMATSLGGSVLKKAVRAARHDEDEALGHALVEHMDGMKGLMMKIGQMASYLEGTLPPAAQAALQKLQQGSEPLPFETIAAVVEEAFGRPLAEVFEAFEDDAIAAASIGQVHRARVGERPVVVKVQYPQIAKTMEVDLGNAERLGLLATVGTKFDRHVVIQELRERFREECDYLQEAANTRHFAALFADDSQVLIPGVLASRCRPTVLTTDFVEGLDFYTFREQASQREKNAAGEQLFSFAFRSIFAHSCFNADPHPGNYLFLPDGRVCFLDFGCVRYFSPDFVDGWKALARAVLSDRRADLPAAMHAAGFVGSRGFDFDYHWDVMQYLYRPFKTANFRYTHDYVAQSYSIMVLKNPNHRKTAMPAEWVFANRLQWGLNSILALLGASGDWPGLFRRWVDTPTIEGKRPAPLQPIDVAEH
jgi:predicted unusual protein kinase regulating ubiquinone biosynthesis (AarF/ABC1/UbiB family)